MQFFKTAFTSILTEFIERRWCCIYIKGKNINLSSLFFQISIMQKIVTDMLQRYCKTISESQMEKIMRKESSCNPLWLTIVCEELQSVENVEDIDQKIEHLPEGLLK